MKNLITLLLQQKEHKNYNKVVLYFETPVTCLYFRKCIRSLHDMALYLHEDAKELLAGKTLVVIGDSGEYFCFIFVLLNF